MKTLLTPKVSTKILSLFLGVGLITIPSLVFAISPSATTEKSTTTSSDSSNLSTSQQQQHLASIKTKGDAEINRRLDQLNKLGSKISSAVHLTASDKSSLTSEVNTEISGLTALETQLNAETTLSAAISDAKNIILEYRVYVLVTPKVWLIKTADDQQAVESKLSTLAGKLQVRITTDQHAGKNVTVLLTSLADMNTQINNAQTLSSSVEATVLPLQPSDYNADTSVLSGYAAKLQTAHSDDVTAYNDAKTIVSDLKSL